MAETVTPMILLVTDRNCEVCGAGRMRPAPQVQPRRLSAVAPGGHVPRAGGIAHTCTECGHIALYPSSYPVSRYIDFFHFISESQAAIAAAASIKTNA